MSSGAAARMKPKMILPARACRSMASSVTSVSRSSARKSSATPATPRKMKGEYGMPRMGVAFRLSRPYRVMAKMHSRMTKADQTVVANSSTARESGISLCVTISMLICVFVYCA